MPILDYEGLANGLLILITGLLGYFGIRRGIRSAGETAAAVNAAAEPKGTIQVAGALIDSKKADELIKAFDRNVIAKTNLEAAVRENTLATNQNNDAIGHVQQQIIHINGGIQALTLEIARKPTKDWDASRNSPD